MVEPKELEKYLIIKEEINEELWKTFLNNSKGTEKQKISAVKTFFSDYRKLPDEANEIIKELASPDQTEKIRKMILSEISGKPTKIPGSIVIGLLYQLKSDPNKEISEKAGLQLKPLQESLFSMALVAQNFQRQLAESMTKIVTNYQQSFFKSLSSLWVSIWENTRFLREPEFQTFEYNWLAFLPVDKILQLYIMHKAGKDDEIKELLTTLGKDREYLDQFIEEMEKNDVFRPRIPIIKDAFYAHCDGKYSLSIPTLLSQIEGILWDIAENKGIADGTTITKLDGTRETARSVKPLIEKTELQNMYMETVTKFFLQKIYTRDFRHGVLHGRIVDYADGEQSMKLIFFLRALLKN